MLKYFLGEVNMSSVKNNRESNIELLRIISMFLIIASHFSVQGEFVFDNTLSLNTYYLQILTLGNIGVNIFVLITGYFLISQKEIKISKILKLLLQLLTYSISTYIIGMLLGIEDFNIKLLIKHIFPMTFRLWWFPSTYIVLYIISPWVNKFLHSLSKNEYTNYLLLCFILWCLIPTFTTQNFEGNNLIWFIFLYSLAGYFKLFYNTDNKSWKRYMIFSVTILLLTSLSVLIFDIIGLKIPFVFKHAIYFYQKQRLPMLLISVSLFLAFLNIKIKNNSFINLVSSTTFGIYLLHESYFGKKIIWLHIFKNNSFLNSKILIPYSIMAILLVFTFGFLVELFRIYVIEKNYSKIIKRLSKHLDNLISKIQTNKVIQKL